MSLLPPPFSLVSLAAVDSTNDEARRRILSGAGHGLTVTAAEQSAGRGRRGRVWHSPLGNLHCSFVLEVGQNFAAAPQLAFVSAVALREALAEMAPNAPFRCKWPNDLLCQGKKLAGMLLEAAPPYVILGVGVNLVDAPSPALYPTTSLRALGSNAEPLDLLTLFAERLGLWHGRWMAEGFTPVRQAWLEHAQGVGEGVTVRLSDGSELFGLFSGLDPDGALLLDQADGTCRPILAGDVFFSS